MEKHTGQQVQKHAGQQVKEHTSRQVREHTGQLLNVYTSQQVLEHTSQHCGNTRVRSMLQDSRLANKFWTEAFIVSNYVRNRSPSSASDAKTPWELLFYKCVM